jgi:hypothetical protein
MVVGGMMKKQTTVVVNTMINATPGKINKQTKRKIKQTTWEWKLRIKTDYL